MKKVTAYSALLNTIRKRRRPFLGCLLVIAAMSAAFPLGGCSTQAIWKIPFDGSASSPVLSDDMLYVGSRDGAIYAIDPDSGTIRWSFQTGEELVSGPEIIVAPPGAGFDKMMAAASSYKAKGKREVDETPVVENGTIFVGSKDYSFYAIDAATGRMKWSFKTEGIISDRAIIDDSTVIFPSTDGFLYALDIATGEKKWAFQHLEGTRTGETPTAIAADGIVYLTTWLTHIKNTPARSFLYAIDRVSGQVKWTVTVEGSLPTPPDYANGTIFFSTSKDYHMEDFLNDPSKKEHDSRPSVATLYAVDASSGTMKWQFQTRADHFCAQPAVVGDMVVWGTDHGLFAMNPETGAERWHRVEEECKSFYTDDRFVYLSAKGMLYALDQETGEEKWSLSGGSGFFTRVIEETNIITPFLPHHISTRIAAFGGDTIYVSADRYMYCLLRETGKELWSFKAETGSAALPLITDGTVYIPGVTKKYFGKDPDQGYFYAIDAGTGGLRPQQGSSQTH